MRFATPNRTLGTVRGAGSRFPVVCYQGERLARAEEKLIKPRRSNVQEAEAILTPSNLEERLDHAVYRELVADEAFEIEGIEEQLPIPGESLVRED